MSLLPFVLRRDVRRILSGCMRRHLRASDIVYDVGCGTKPLAGVLSELGLAHVGIDMDGGFYGEESVDIIAVADALPVREGIADAVLSSQVIEHLPDPEAALQEARRVLKPGGHLFISFPLLFPLHAAPHDFFRYTSHGFRAMCQRHGFEIVEEHDIGGYWYMASVFSERYFHAINRSILRRLGIVFLLTLPLHWLFWILHQGEALAYRLIGKDARSARRTWALNYVYVARRSGADDA